jgi:TfoX/Sxy family transcriptional regulator of competence genes
MTDHKTYTSIANELLSDPRVTKGNLFGVPVLKIGGKPFAGLYQKDLVVKLGIDRVREMLKAKTGMPFDPSGRNHPMKEWIRIKESATQSKKKWLTLAVEARAFVEQQSG